MKETKRKCSNSERSEKGSEGIMKGRVFLVGAGPGDVGLLTIKGKEILEHAQVVVCDHLVGEEIMSLIPRDAELIDAGKRAGSHTMTQEEINQTLLEKAQEGKCVVRLKGGDPFLFGRGAEELELLLQQNIPFEVVPGVTSAFSVPAYNGIPVTHRDFASSVHILTGHRRQGEPSQFDFEALARLSGTLVFLMGVSALEEICRGLLAAGMGPQTPAAVLQQGTCAGQKKMIAGLADITQEAKRQGVHPPAIFVVGEVCELGKRFGWYEKLPLFGHKVLVTRPSGRGELLADRLRQLGAQVLEHPTIRIEKIKENRRLWREFEHLSQYNYLVFTSPAGVTVFFDELAARGYDIRSLGMAKIVALGPGTAQEIFKRGLLCPHMPQVYDGEHLGILLGEICEDGDKIFIPRAANGNLQLIREIQKRACVEVTDLPIYRTVCEEFPEYFDVKGQVEAGQISMVVFTSASTVRGFAEAAKGLDYSLVRAVCIGRQTESAAQEFGMKTMKAKEATIDGIVEACIKLSNGGTDKWI